MHRSTLESARARLRIVAAGPLLLAAAACGSAPPPPPAPAPPPPVVSADSPWRDVRVCVVDEQGVREVPARYNVTTGDTLVDGRRYADAFPTGAQYAESAQWYINSEPVMRGPLQYVRYGLPRVIGPGEIVRDGDYRGVMIFSEAGDANERKEVLYAAVRPGCEFQPYSGDLLTNVRG